MKVPAFNYYDYDLIIIIVMIMKNEVMKNLTDKLSNNSDFIQIQNNSYHIPEHPIL